MSELLVIEVENPDEVRNRVADSFIQAMGQGGLLFKEMGISSRSGIICICDVNGIKLQIQVKLLIIKILPQL